MWWQAGLPPAPRWRCSPAHAFRARRGKQHGAVFLPLTLPNDLHDAAQILLLASVPTQRPHIHAPAAALKTRARRGRRVPTRFS